MGNREHKRNRKINRKSLKDFAVWLKEAFEKEINKRGLHDEVAKSNPKLERGKAWCVKCGRMEKVSTAECLRNGWPECCGATMTVDSPTERDMSKGEPPKNYDYEETKKMCKYCLERGKDFCKGTEGYFPHCIYVEHRKFYLMEEYGEEDGRKIAQGVRGLV